MTARTVDEALQRFELIAGPGSEHDGKGCVTTVLAWVNGDAWSDHLPCANRLLRNAAIRANDDAGTTPAQRADMVRAGAAGLLDTWWVPDIVVLWQLSECTREGVSQVGQMLELLGRVAAWKVDHARPPADLRDAVLRGAVLSGADLRGADLSYAVLRGAVLRDADLSGADLSGADLSGTWGNRWTVLPAGWKVADSGLIVKSDQ